MPSRFEKYRVKDGLTKLGEAFFNPVFQDIDLRLVGIEALRISWEEAVRSVTEYGLVRVNEVIGPTLLDATTKADEIETKRLAAVGALAALESIVASIEADATAGIAAFESSATTDIAAWKATQLAAIQTWKDSITPDLPTINARLTALEGGTFTALAYDNRGDLRTGTPAANQMAVVEGLGLFIFYVGSDEPDDDESAFATSNGRWLLEAAHWDVIDAWQQVDDDARDVRLDDIETRWPGRVLYGTAVSSITSLAGAGGQASFTGTVTGAAVGDMVVATPPDALSGLVAAFARVTSANTVTVYLNNPSAATATLATGTWQLAVLKTT